MKIPKAVTWLNFPGDVTSGCMIGQAMGPNTMGETLFIVEAVYDPDKNSTRVGLSHLRPGVA